MRNNDSPRPAAPSEPVLLDALFVQSSLRNYSKGELIIRSDDPDRDIYYVKTGYIKTYSLTQRGEVYVHLVFGPGEIFPLTSARLRTKHNINMEALSACSLHHITQTAFNEQLARSLALTTDFSNRVIDQFTIYTDRVDNLLYKYVQERLVYHLLSLAQRFGTKNSKGWHVIAAPISQQVIANSINASRENVSREFERLQRKGLVSFSNKLIAIPDLMSLAKVLPGETRLGL